MNSRACQIKNCPVCNGKGQLRYKRYSPSKIRFRVICINCYKDSPWYRTPKKAIKAWNKKMKNE